MKQAIALRPSNLVLAMVLVLLVQAVFAQEDTPIQDPSIASFIRDNNIHKIAGYIALGSAVSTGIAGFVSEDLHKPLAYVTLGSALTTSTLGAIAYWDEREYAWPHFLLMGLAEVGFAMNAFEVFEPGSLPHRITGISAIVAMAAGYVAIRVLY